MDPIVWDSFHTTKHTNRAFVNTRFDMSFTLVCYFRTGCSLKIVFFPNLLQPIPCMKEINSSVLRSECTVTLIGWAFSVQPKAAQCLRERSRKILKILGKNTIFNEHPFVDWKYNCVLHMIIQLQSLQLYCTLTWEIS